MERPTNGTVDVGANQGTNLHMSGDPYTFKLVGRQTGGALTLLKAFVPPRGGPPPHFHQREDEVFYVLKGELEFQTGEHRITAGPGSCLFVPKGTVHGFYNVTSAPARMRVTFTPAGLEQMFFEVGRPATPGTVPLPPDETELTKLLAVAPKYGVDLLYGG